ncbi:hypothetical protein NDU88_007819 [Pleurodeles waltl]|uniref:Uncharacterized protein n=1 Tax=Pleurodeles waltl TaxID=8319 RepID=A0AAV7NXC8_PLEWA|nr:hypothetical protein NDU88_007819 [Pleurodeles waltl]
MDRHHFTTDRWTDTTSRPTDGPTPLHDRPMDRHHFTTDRWTDNTSRQTDGPTTLHDRPMDRHGLTTNGPILRPTTDLCAQHQSNMK